METTQHKTDADAANNNAHRRRRRTATAPRHLSDDLDQTTQTTRDRDLQQDGAGNPIDCASILIDGPPVFGEPAAAEQAAEDAGDGRDTNGSFDESVMLYQLCLEQEEKKGGNGVSGGNTNNNNAATGTGVIYVGPDETAATHGATNSGAGLPLKYLCAPYDDPQTTKVSLSGTSAPVTKPRGKFLSYSYDVHVRTPTHVLEAGAEYEATMVRYLARKLGLEQCAGGNDGQRKTFRLLKNRTLRRRSLQDGEVRYEYEDDVPVVVGISAEPRDMPDYDADCNEHYLGVPTKCYHMNGSLALYFRPDAPDDLVQAEAEDVLRLISRGMVEDRFQTSAIPIAVFVEGGVMGDNSNNNSDKDKDGGKANNADTTNNGSSPTVPVVPEVASHQSSGGLGSSIFAPSDPSVASASSQDAAVTSNAGGGDGGGGDSGSSSSATYAGIGAAIAAVALVVVVALFVRRRRRNLANKYSLREVGGSGHLADSPEINADGVVIVDKSKSHRKSNSHNFSDGTYGESPTLPNTPSSFDADDDGNYQEAVELGLTEAAAAATAAIAEAAAASAHRGRTASKDSQGSGFFTAAQSVQKTRSVGSNTTAGADNVSPRAAAAGADDDANSVGSDESGVTIELDMNRVNSTVSEITWAGPQAQREANAVGNILNRFPPYKSLYSGQGPGAIAEEDDDFDEHDEDVIAGGASASSQRSTGGGSTDFGPAPVQRMM